MAPAASTLRQELLAAAADVEPRGAAPLEPADAAPAGADGPAGGLTNGQAFASVVKCALGAGVFALPLTFQRAGWLLGAGATVAMAAACTHTMGMLVQSERRVRHLTGAPRALTYPQLAGQVLAEGERARAAVTLGVGVLIVAGSVAVCGAFVAFVTGTLALELGVPRRAVLAAACALELVLCQLRSFALLSRASGVGNAAIGAGFGVVLAYGLVHAPPPRLALRALLVLARPAELARALGPIAFNFAVHFSLLPVGQATREPAAFGRVVRGAFGLLAVLDASFATACVALYGDRLRSNVIDSIGADAAREAAAASASAVSAAAAAAATAPHLEPGGGGVGGGGLLASLGAVISVGGRHRLAQLAVSMTKWLLSLSLLLTVPLVMAAARELVEGACAAALDGASARRELRRRAAVAGGIGVDEGGDEADAAASAAAEAAAPGSQQLAQPAWRAWRVRVCGLGVGARALLSTCVRAALTGCLGLLVLAVPDFGLLVGFAGGVAAAGCGLVLPPLIHARTHRLWLTRAALLTHCLISGLGVVVVVTSCYSTLRDALEHHAAHSAAHHHGHRGGHSGPPHPPP